MHGQLILAIVTLLRQKAVEATFHVRRQIVAGSTFHVPRSAKPGYCDALTSDGVPEGCRVEFVEEVDVPPGGDFVQPAADAVFLALLGQRLVRRGLEHPEHRGQHHRADRQERLSNLRAQRSIINQ